MERYISKFLVNGHVKPGPVGRSYGSMQRTHNFCIPNMETTVPFGRTISVRQLVFTVHSDNIFLNRYNIGESSFTLVASLTFAYHYLMSLIKKKTLNIEWA